MLLHKEETAVFKRLCYYFHNNVERKWKNRDNNNRK